MFLQNALLIVFFAAVMFPAKACSSADPDNSNAKAAVSPTPPTSPDTGEAKGEREKMDVLTQKIIAKDPSAILLAKQIGSSAATSLKPLAKHEDPVVREIALRCLEQSGGENVAEVFADALTDESSSVKIAALAGLNTHLTPSVYNQLLQAFDQLDTFPEGQQQIALLLGRMESANQDDLRQRYSRERDPVVNEGLVAALAKLGDANAQAKFAAGVENSKDRERKRYIDYAEYINQQWAARALAPVLLDKSEMLRIGVDGLPGAVPEYLRACDLAVNVIAKITGTTFSFPVNGRTNYTDEQLMEVRQFLVR
jgi:hypothetical protein